MDRALVRETFMRERDQCPLSTHFDLSDDNAWFLDTQVPKNRLKNLVVIFDLDDTLIMDTTCGSRLCAETLRVLDFFSTLGCRMYVASHNSHAQDFCRIHGLSSYFTRVFPSPDKSKSELVGEIWNEVTGGLGIYFDDIGEYVTDVSQDLGAVGLVGCKVDGRVGVTMRDVSKSLLLLL